MDTIEYLVRYLSLPVIRHDRVKFQIIYFFQALSEKVNMLHFFFIYKFIGFNFIQTAYFI